MSVQTPMPDAQSFAAVVARVKSAAIDAGLSRDAASAAVAGLAPNADVLVASDRQPEHVRTPGSYVTAVLSDTRIANGCAALDDNAEMFAALETRFAVPRNILAAIWGIETNFGASTGTVPTVAALATLAAAGGRRATFWEAECVAAITYAHANAIDPQDLTGSWAGAFGQTQFMPTTALRFAVDVDGDGTADLRASAADALGSAANYLLASGWQAGLTWGVEVVLPPAFDYASAAPEERRTLEAWRSAGAAPQHVPSDWEAGVPSPGASAFRLLLPEGAGYPTFLVSDNFDALLAYNRAIPYALSVGLLAERFQGREVPSVAWRASRDALSRDDIRTLQSHLVDLGWDTGGIDGILGPKSIAAVRGFQQQLGVRVDGYPDPALLNAVSQARTQ